MSIRNKIILGFVVIFSTFFFLFVRWVSKEVKPRYLEAIEEPLVDVSRILSSYLSLQVKEGKLDTTGLNEVLNDAANRKFSAKIYHILKEKVDVRVYVTDQKGIVTFDSEGSKEVGQDFSKWNDVKLSLLGQYGARSTKRVADEPTTGSLYVSAPIYSGESILGVVTVAKPVNRLFLFIYLIRTKLIAYAILTLVLIITTSSIMAWKVVYPLKLLTQYAKDIRDGKSPKLINEASGEVGELQKAFEEMRITLEGKELLEQYVQTLTHELKSPLAAVRGAAELLKEELPSQEKAKFISNILGESERMQQMVEKLLNLVIVEKKGGLVHAKNFNLSALIKEIADSTSQNAIQKRIKTTSSGTKDALVFGDELLIRQAIVNLVQNAVDFAPSDSEVKLSIEKAEDDYLVRVIDDGPGIPEFAGRRIFEKFYSLARPATGRKSTGLGLPFVKEVSLLHHGSIEVKNRPEKGAEAVLRLPVSS